MATTSYGATWHQHSLSNGTSYMTFDDLQTYIKELQTQNEILFAMLNSNPAFKEEYEKMLMIRKLKGD